MSGSNRAVPNRFESLDCPVEAGEPCVVPQREWRKVDSAIVVTIVGIVVSMLLWAGGPGGVNSHFSSLDTVIIQHEKEDKSLHEAQERYERRTEERQMRIEEKLDRLVERRR